MTLAQAIAAVVAEWKSNPRLRWGGWGIVGVLWLSAILFLRDEVGNAANEYRALSRKVERTRMTSTQEQWVALRDDARKAALALEGQLWREGTVGLSQATFDDWIRMTASQAGIRGAQVAVVAQPEETSAARTVAGSGSETTIPSDLWRINARLAFDFHPASFYPLLAKIHESERAVVVESLRIRGGPASKAELQLVAYFQKPTSAVGREVSGQQEPK